MSPCIAFLFPFRPAPLSPGPLYLPTRKTTLLLPHHDPIYKAIQAPLTHYPYVRVYAQLPPIYRTDINLTRSTINTPITRTSRAR
jgi:hypothetical protein